MAGPIDVVSGYLDESGVDYEIVTHPERFTAAAEARAAGVGPADAAKDVLLRVGNAYVLTVIPASERLDLKKVWALLDAEDRPSLATEDEIAARLPEFELGSIPTVRPDPRASRARRSAPARSRTRPLLRRRSSPLRADRSGRDRAPRGRQGRRPVSGLILRHPGSLWVRLRSNHG